MQEMQSGHPSKGFQVLLFLPFATRRGLTLLEQLVFKCHVGFRLKTDACTEDVRESSTLFGEGVDNRGAGRREWRLALLDC